jgi:hypothetical protein
LTILIFIEATMHPSLLATLTLSLSLAACAVPMTNDSNPPRSTANKPNSPSTNSSAAPVPTVSAAKVLSNGYIDNGDGTITDKKNKLMWKKCSEGSSGAQCEQGKPDELLWSTAMKQYAKPTSFAGYQDWRMPTISELRTVILCSDGTPLEQALEKSCGRDSYPFYTSHPEAFPNSSIGYWSSSVTEFNPAGVWEIELYVGTDSWQPVNASGPASKRTRAVRKVRTVD